MSKYLTLNQILKENHPSPTYLDAININYKGIKVKVYGTLHAITGGTNKDYINFITLIKTIIKEKLSKKSNFEKSEIKIPSEISGDKKFHLLKPTDTPHIQIKGVLFLFANLLFA